MLEDYDWWAEQGCLGWSGEELLPAMNRLENDLDFGDAPYHGRGGPITISRPPISRWGKVDLALLEAGLDAGHPWHDDLNAPESTGISATPLNRTEESRISTNDGYLEPARARANLTIQCGAQVDRVLFDGKRAIGVSAVIDGQLREFRGHEVILSAGSTFSPPILIRSGVGPADDILFLGRDVVSDVPVGKNLLDHASVGVQLRLTEAGRCQSWEERNLNCYIRYSSGMPETGLNDMVLGCRNINGYDADGLLTGALSVILWQSFSRGELRVRDLDPFSMPQIDQNLLSDERDLVRMRTGARELFEIAQSRPVQAITSDICLGEGVTGTTQKRIEDVKDQRALDEWLMETVRDTWHLVGTCRMGGPDDRRTVVDSECRVL
jgi:choline dehydrogenase